MDDYQSERKSINLTKETDNKQRVREAYPVYKNSNIDTEALERQEYRNVETNYQQPQTMYQDPPPAVNRYDIPDVQPGNREDHSVLKNTNDDLGQYYDYAVPESNPVPQPQIPPVQQQAAQPPVMQHAMKFCKYCGERIPADAVLCTHCGRQVEVLKSSGGTVNKNSQPSYAPAGFAAISNKNKTTAILLALFGFIGCAGLHRFYTGKVLSGMLYLLTGGLCCIGTIVDIINLANGTFQDGSGRIVKK